MFKKLTTLVVAFAVALVAVAAFSTSSAQAASGAKVSFTFDDGLLSTYTQAAPALAAYGYQGTVYATTGCIGSVGTCAADEDVAYMSWAQLGSLHTSYGWEVGAHTVTHPLMTEISDAQKVTELAQAKQDLQAHGFNPVSFATPYGDYNPTVQLLAMQYYTSHRGFWDTGYNTTPYDRKVLRVQQVQAGVSLAQVKAYIDQANADGTWLILVFHEVQPSPSTDPEDYQYATADLSAIAAYVQALGLDVTTVGDAVGDVPLDTTPPPQTDQMVNGNFDAGINQGWVTDTPANVVANSNNRGSGPTPQTSVRLTASTTSNVHLFAPQIAVSMQDYVVSLYLRLTRITSQELGFYIDEYDKNGNWISGQWKAAKSAKYTGEISFFYTPSSANVATASLQIYVMQGSNIRAFVDNVRWLGTSPSTPVPEPTPEPTPEPEPTPVPTLTNLLPNPGFDSGLGGWTTDSPANVTADSSGQGSGSSPATSLKLTSKASGNTHLFSPAVTVAAGQSYSLSAYLNVTALGSGEVGFYIDEYDAGGSWISGKWVTAVYATGSQTLSFSYTPTSASVATASLQIYLYGSGITAYVDNIQWLPS